MRACRQAAHKELINLTIIAIYDVNFVLVPEFHTTWNPFNMRWWKKESKKERKKDGSENDTKINVCFLARVQWSVRKKNVFIDA